MEDSDAIDISGADEMLADTDLVASSDASEAYSDGLGSFVSTRRLSGKRVRGGRSKDLLVLQSYDWNDPANMRKLLDGIRRPNDLVVAYAPGHAKSWKRVCPTAKCLKGRYVLLRL